MEGRLERLSWAAAGAATVGVSTWALLDASLYDGLINPSTRPGAIGQDIVNVLAGAWLCLVAARRDLQLRTRLVAMGVLGYLFYGYGIYTIERMYNPLYLVYLFVFTIAFWSLILAAGKLMKRPPSPTLARRLRVTSAIGALLQPAIFYPLWIGMLIPLMRDRDQIDSLYSIFVLDLCFVMPAFLFVGLGLIRQQGWALLLAPGMFVLGSILMASLTIAELAKPMLGQPFIAAGVLPPLALAVLFAALAGVHLHNLQFRASPDHASTELQSTIRF
jgi:hypothetical protein